MIRAHQLTIDELFSDPDFPALVEEYRRHAIAEVAGGTPDLEFYRKLEHAPGVTVWAVRSHDRLTGFAVLLVKVAPHSGATTASTESLFAVEGGAVLRRELADYAATQGASVLLIAAPYGSRASKALIYAGMRPCTIIHALPL